MSKHRTQLFLEQRQYEILASLATAEGVTISEIVRRLVDQGLRQRSSDRDRQLALLREAADLRREIEHDRGVYPGDPVAEARQQTEEEMDAVLTRRLEP